MWQHNLSESAELILEIEAGSSFWPTQLFETLTFNFIFPFINKIPWQWITTLSILEI